MAWACLQVFTCPGLRIHDYHSQSQLFPRVFHYWGIFLSPASLPLQKAQIHLMYTAEGDLFYKFFEPLRFTCVSWVFHVEKNVCGVDFVLNYDLCCVEVACDWSTETCFYSHPVQVTYPRQFWACCTKDTTHSGKASLHSSYASGPLCLRASAEAGVIVCRHLCGLGYGEPVDQCSCSAPQLVMCFASLSKC